MNKYVILLSVFAVLFFSCAKEPAVNKVQPGETITFTAGWADSDATRTVLQSDGTSVWWTPGEEIMVYYGNKFSGKFTSTNTESQALASFSGNLSVMTGTVEEGNGSQSFIAVYPYDAAVACDGENVTLVVPSVQTAVSGTFADNLFPAIAKSSNLDLAFYNVCGGTCFSVSHWGIQTISFKAIDGKPLVGTIKVGFGSDGLPEIKGISNGKSEVLISAPSGCFVPGKKYYAAFVPQTLSKGLSMTFLVNSESATVKIENILQVNRSRFGVLEEKDKDLTFSVDYPEPVDLGLPSGLKWASFNLGATKPEEYGDYFAWGETEPYYEPGYAQSSTPVWKSGKEAGYSYSSYRWISGGYNGGRYRYNKYCTDSEHGYNGFTDGKTVLDLEDDAAHVILGGNWRLPTKEDVSELLSVCTTVYNTYRGFTIIGPNGNTIFLPFSGDRIGTYFYKASYAEYMTSSLYFEDENSFWNDSEFHLLSIADKKISQGYMSRTSGVSIRPVYSD